MVTESPRADAVRESDALDAAMPPASAFMPALTRATLDAAPTQVLRDGRWANARVLRVEAAGGAWVVKDFRPRGFAVRNTVGRLLLRRELRALQRLAGIDGVPGDAFRIDGHAIAARFIPGTPLAKVELADLPPSYFEALEALLSEVHARGLVHLDTRGAGNLLVRPDRRPALIDFQAALATRWMPRAWRRWLEDLDLSGVYKRWMQRDPASMGPERAALYERITRGRRRWWILRGYLGAPRKQGRGAL